MTKGRDHGGDLARAIAIHGGHASGWIDLSTGINRTPYPSDIISDKSLRGLPDSAAMTTLLEAASLAYSTKWPLAALAGAQAAIQLLPTLVDPGALRILSPTYNEFAGAFESAGWQVEQVTSLADLRDARVAVVVNPNNPTGAVFDPAELLSTAQRAGLLIVDESFSDPTPATSLLPHAMPENVIVLRSFGKFFGLAGLRLGFAAGPLDLVTKIVNGAGPWRVSGPALEIGSRALSDTAWQARMRTQLSRDATRCDQLVTARGWRSLGGTALFRLYETPDAVAAQDKLARHHIWTRVFPYSETWLRLGIPGPEIEWRRLEAALKQD